VLIYSNTNNYHNMIEPYNNLLGLIHTATGNEAQNAINSILDQVPKINDVTIGSKLYEITLDYLKKGGNYSLWFKTSYRLGKLYLDKHELNKLNDLVESLKSSCYQDIKNNILDQTKTSSLLETIELEIQLCILNGDKKRMKKAYLQSQDLVTAINDPRILGPIKESGGKM